MKLSVVIPVRNEEKGIRNVALALIEKLRKEAIAHELVLVNDASSDTTPRVLLKLSQEHTEIKIADSFAPHGFGIAIRKGLECASGDYVVVYMGDGSDDPADVVAYFRKLEEGYDCVFGSRFIKGSSVSGYPWIKLILNRLGNECIRALFMISYNDVSNAFKGYRISVIKAVQPLVSQYFNITVELPLKAIIRKFSYCVIPINWRGRESGVSKYNIRALSRKYFFSILFVWLEKLLLKEEIPGRKA